RRWSSDVCSSDRPPLRAGSCLAASRACKEDFLSDWFCCSATISTFDMEVSPLSDDLGFVPELLHQGGDVRNHDSRLALRRRGERPNLDLGGGVHAELGGGELLH